MDSTLDAQAAQIMPVTGKKSGFVMMLLEAAHEKTT